MSTASSHPEEWRHKWIDVSGPDSGLLVVLIHGTLDRSAGMARLSRLTARTHQTIRFDRRGYGRNVEHPGPFDVSGNSDDVVRIVGSRQVVLIGHSYGGNVALAAAERLGNQVVGVSTYETPLSWFDWWPRNSAGGAALTVAPEDAAETFMIRMIGEKRWNELPSATRAQRRREGVALTGELGDLRRAAPWNASNIQCPVLCGRGTRGPEHHLSAPSYLASMLPDGKECIIADAGHGAPISHPQDFYDALIKPHFEGSGTFTLTS
jgi:pimeloyl-ACP methyl ester carboxylesterase